ncbi:hypothetical protein DUE52_23455 [Larkinella punicea]|uniref:Uncharacterized protein n=1 Tax=Larkinella punicea TaxID=2315727 RepID=A0A368JH83_9BACT|nr:hypothetical protein DUE52_23455 [Larkinella punicea]
MCIATEVEIKNEEYKIKYIGDIPKLFCDFPLIGTETFYLPVIVNSFYFSPQTERDGIWLKGSDDPEVDKNKYLLETAMEIYIDLINDLQNNEFKNLFNIVESRFPLTNLDYFDELWFKNHIHKRVKDYVFNAKIVEIESEIGEKKSIQDLWFPMKSYENKLREKI